METKNTFNQKILKLSLLTFFGFTVLYFVIPFIFYQWPPQLIDTYFSTAQLLKNGLFVNVILSVYMMIPVFIILIINSLRKYDKSITTMQIIASTILTCLIMIGLSIFSISTVASFIDIPGGIIIRLSDLEPLGFILITGFYSSIICLIILILEKVLKEKKHSLLLIIISLTLLLISPLKINGNVAAVQSLYSLKEKCQAAVSGLEDELILTPLERELKEVVACKK